jgi:hypothetical protein
MTRNVSLLTETELVVKTQGVKDSGTLLTSLS